MKFVTITFVVFAALVFTGYWAIRRRRAQNALLLAASYAFYAWWDWRFCSLMLASSLVDYGVGRALARTEGVSRRRAWVGLSCATNLGLLAAFKYCDFFIESLVTAAGWFGGSWSIASLRWVLPVGISFYTFQTLGYTFDVYRRKLAPTRDLLDYLTFVSFFPQLVAGPIERAGNLLPQFQTARRFDRALAESGCRLILWGFIQKAVFADQLARVADQCYAAPGAWNGAALLTATAAFALQIYFDFAGYSNIAVGTARCFGIRLMRNFATPYFAASVREFWQRWHISLSTWFRDYVYLPLGGSRVGRGRLVANLLITFGLSGLWHGAQWHYVWWGVLNGLLLTAGALRRHGGAGTTEPEGVQRAWRTARTAALIGLTWVLFRAESMQDAGLIFGRLFTEAWHPAAWAQLAAFAPPERAALALGVAGVLLEWLTRAHEEPFSAVQARAPRWVAYSVGAWTVALLGTWTANAFIYFRF